MHYQPIEDYGIIGDLKTVALVGLNGSIDYMCFPDFDSPSIFASLLDKKKGGYFQICPHLQKMKLKQLYLPDTNVLLTRFLCEDGVGEITDFMPVGDTSDGSILVRRITNVRGVLTYRLKCCPRFNYARSSHTSERLNEKQITFISDGDKDNSLHLKSTVPLEIKKGDGFAEFTLKTGEIAEFVLETAESDKVSLDASKNCVEECLTSTIDYWRKWITKSAYKGRWFEAVNRSALVLKLLTSQKNGSIIAAPTFSLPEKIGGKRNWDYRYTWIRDASFTIYAFLRLGFKEEAMAFIQWAEARCENIGEGGSLGLMYTIDGKKKLVEEELDHLEGYKKSAPVRIGNNAHGQLQLDIYGELLDSIYLYNKYGEPISNQLWQQLTREIDWLCDNWQQADHGIWEVRGGKKEFLYSRLMSWVAFDRAIKIARSRSFPFPEQRWQAERDKIYDSVFNEYWDSEIESFVQFKGSKAVDASLLLMPMVKFISPKDPLWLSTLRYIEQELVSDSLVFRYQPEEAASDGIGGDEGTFSMASFWYVENLSRAGELEKARLYLEKMLGYANHVGLFAEQLGPCGEHLGNFPQAFSHLGLISAACDLDRRMNEER
ncbi:glycoside hydrolase family 15 protein [Christiangramia sp.]|uniref:glycoside hydrolase family 15 protein n=1 Tax=Christiangramia sp. TaxID=1931228 RepID=UPI002616E4E5|nr:glycoside hydrolase family 15 protein [Christiangramia sp.]